ncbi:hypothetical protein Plo01_54780 [Planobispora longispora]|uniref:Uncharacterized protein n=2 Tax=Planobispora longispora TaxID=28887 RepID=A0A8J3RPZ7_9ACTN|nr:hypothetical protein Plo01_54780 [Planobispora longispora]
MTPTLPSQLTPPGTVSAGLHQGDSPLRLSLPSVLNRRAAVDGAWWPYSCDATAELPGLIVAVDRLLDRATVRVGVHQDVWERIPHRIPARERAIRVGWFRYADSRVITLIFAAAEPIVLLVIPPGTAVGSAEAILKLTAQDTTGLTPDDILPIAHLPTDFLPRAMAADSLARWKNGGGPATAGQDALSSARPPSA